MGIVERKEREKEARRSTILEAAEKVFSEKGFIVATMDDIARSAELAKGTVYLYYKSKEELMIGLMMRGFDLMLEKFSLVMADRATYFDKLLNLGTAYWQFAHDHPFYFGLLNFNEPIKRNPQISTEAISGLHEKSNEVWRAITELIEGAKGEGMVRPEVDSFTVGMLLWLNATGVLRMQSKAQSTPDHIFKNKEEFDLCNCDWSGIYGLNGSLLLHEIVTTKGAEKLGPLVWPKIILPTKEECETKKLEEPALRLMKFADEEFSMLEKI